MAGIVIQLRVSTQLTKSSKTGRPLDKTLH